MEENELVIKKNFFSPKEKYRARCLYGEFYQTFNEKLTSIFLKFFQKIEGNTFQFILWIEYIHAPKEEKDIARKNM